MRWEFHISRKIRDFYQFDESLFSFSGSVILPNFHAARLFAQKINEKRDRINFPEKAVKPGQINAMGLIDEIFHYIIGLYRRGKNPLVMEQAINWLYEKVGRGEVEDALRKFTEEFPPLAIYRGEVLLDPFIEGESEGISHRSIILEEMLMLWLANMNPAFAPL
ncbi:MAG: alpha-amylase, partial [Thermodesulfobacteriota bacterium]